MDVRSVIKRRMRSVGWTAYRLAREVKAEMSSVAVYDYLRGDSEMTASNLGHIFDALDLRLVGGDAMAKAFETGRLDAIRDTTSRKASVARRGQTGRGAKKRD